MTAARLRAGVLKLQRTPPFLIVQKVLRQVPFRPVDIGKLCFLRLDGVPRIPRSRLRGPGVVRRALEQDVPGLVALRDQTDIFLQRFAAGDHCVVAEVNGRIVAYELEDLWSGWRRVVAANQAHNARLKNEAVECAKGKHLSAVSCR